ncbi:MAG: molybdenum cofactor biosynthesis protein MoaE [Proteobacteria bacterium]|nr:molybdenum cofactor biosynthesis protein MoaE [Pseudomonadota bacterium]
MDLNATLAEIRSHPRFNDAGMVLFHVGVVRGFDLNGRTVTRLDVAVDEARAEAIRAEMLERPGIVEIVIRLESGSLRPGDPIMLAAVAGETRDHVFPVMTRLIERLKAEASRKTEHLL